MRALRFAAAAALFATLATSSVARANGRFPEANQIFFSPADPDVVMLRVTFGLLISHDRGKTFQWVCEQSIGYSGVEDPTYTITPSGAVVGTTFEGLTVSRDNACNWGFADKGIDNGVFIDLTWNPNDRKNVIVFASAYDKQNDAGDILFASSFYESKDEAQTFTKLSGTLDPSLLGYTVDLTKADPNRIYATAVREPGTAPKGVLLVSRNHGETWEEEAVALVDTERTLFIAAVDPTNPERVYIRTSGGTDKPTRLIVREAVDGGPATQRTVYTAKGPLQGFALAPDGSKIYVGGPKDGLLVASTQDFAFTQRLPLDDAGAPSIQVQCLALGADGLWACSNERSGFIAGLSKDDGATFEPRLRFCDIQGPLATCAAGSTTNDRCAPNWAAQQANLGCGPNASSGGPGGSDGGTSDGGASPVAQGSSGNCNCNTAPAGPWGAVVAAAGAALALVRRARRRSR